MRDYAKEFENRVAFIRDLLKSSGAKGVIYGNSGGKDSALVGILCKAACDNTVGIMMPCASKRNFGEDMTDGLAVAEAYFANVAKVAEKKPTILGHFDLIKKINGGNKFFDENDPRYTAAANSALMAAARNRCVLEVNTSAAYRGFRKDYFPSDAILKEWLVLSGNVVITADAHDTKALTFGFEAVAAKLKELGYTKVQVLGKDGFTPCAL